MNKFDQAFKKYIVEDAEERAWEHRQIQDAAKKAKAMKKKGEKVNFNKLADHYGVSANDIKKACNESYVKENARRAAAGLDMDGLMADEERYNKAKAQSGSKYVYYDRSMQPGGVPGSAEYVEDLEDVKEIIEYSKKVKTPAGVDMWEDPEGNILNKVK